MENKVKKDKNNATKESRSITSLFKHSTSRNNDAST